MRTLLQRTPARGERGATMIEVLVSIVILTFGLLGVAGLQAQIKLAEVEAYQRAQAIVLLQDMVDRLNANRRNSMSYVTATAFGGPAGTDIGAFSCAGLTGADLDLCDWNNSLVGVSETLGGASVGAMIGARGCVTNLAAAMPREFVVAVVWQGITPTLVPKSTDCGQGSYGKNDAARRAMIARVKIGCLQNDPTTGLCTYN